MFHSSLLFAYYIFSHFVNIDACNLGVLAVKDFRNLLESRSTRLDVEKVDEAEFKCNPALLVAVG